MIYLKIRMKAFPKIIMAHRFATDVYYTSGYRTFNCLELVYVEEGEWSVEMDGYLRFTAKTGDIFICAPNIEHRVYTEPGEKCSVHCSIILLANFEYEILNENKLANLKYPVNPFDEIPTENSFFIIPFHYAPDPGMKPEERFNSVIREFNAQSCCHSYSLSGYVFLLMSAMTESCLRSAKPSVEDLNPASNYLYARKIMDYLKKNYIHPLDLDDLSDYIELHPNYICNIFKKTTHQTLTGCLNGIRIEKAKQLLLTTNCSINMVCRMVGIGNEQYFGRLFKRMEGITPKQYRSLRYKLPGSTPVT